MFLSRSDIYKYHKVFIILFKDLTSSQFLLFRRCLGDLVNPEDFQDVQFPQQLLLLGLGDLAGLEAQESLGLLLQEIVAHLVDLPHVDQIGPGVLLLLGIGQLLLLGLQLFDKLQLLCIGDIGIVLEHFVELFDAAITTDVQRCVGTDKSLQIVQRYVDVARKLDVLISVALEQEDTREVLVVDFVTVAQGLQIGIKKLK